MADIAQCLMSPATLTALTPLGTSNRLDVTSLPIGLSGFLEARADPSLGSGPP